MAADGQRHDRIPPLPAGVGGDEEVVLPARNRMIAALSGSLLTSLLVTPLDVVRVRLQSQQPPVTLPTQHSHISPNLGVSACCREVYFAQNPMGNCIVAPNSVSTLDALTHCAADEVQSRNITSTIDGLRKIARYEGFTSLWRGLSPTLVMAVPSNVIYFTAYESLRYSKRSPLRQYLNDTTAPLTAGSLARIAAATAIGPLEMFRTRLQATSANLTLAEKRRGGQFMATLRGMTALVAEQGYSSLWRGLSLTLWRDVPFSGLYWLGYETLKTQIMQSTIPGLGRDSRKSHSNTFFTSFISGFVSGGLSSIVTQPFDVGKTRQQVFAQAGNGQTANGFAKYGQKSRMTKVLVEIWTEEGVKGLWKGVTARTLKVAPACAIMISSYEIGKRLSA